MIKATAMGYQAFATFHTPANVSVLSFATEFQVPAPPSSWPTDPVPSAQAGPRLDWYAFPGLVNSPYAGAAEEILQPVLSYGETVAGGGAYWTIAAEYVPETGAGAVSPALNVSEGEVIVTEMYVGSAGVHRSSSSSSRSSSNDVKWSVIAYIKGQPSRNVSLVVSRSNTQSQPYGYLAVEAYYLDECTMFPASGGITFTNIDIRLVDSPHSRYSPDWELVAEKAPYNLCQASVSQTGSNDSDIDIRWSN